MIPKIIHKVNQVDKGQPLQDRTQTASGKGNKISV